MKKYYTLLIMIVILIFSSSCTNEKTIYIVHTTNLNHEPIIAYGYDIGINVNVINIPNEELLIDYVKNKKNRVDIVYTGNRSVQELINRGFLKAIDFKRIPNYTNIVLAKTIENVVDVYFDASKKYFIPYHWYTFGIVYDETKAEIVDAVETYGWQVFFDNSILPDNSQAFVSDIPRDVIALAQLYLEYSINSIDDEEINTIDTLIENTSMNLTDDHIKYLFTEKQADILFSSTTQFLDDLSYALKNNENITYNMYVPDNNVVFFDCFSIMKSSKNKAIAYDFLNHMLESDVIYDQTKNTLLQTTFTNAYNDLLLLFDQDHFVNHPSFFPNYVDGQLYLNLDINISKKYYQIYQKIKK